MHVHMEPLCIQFGRFWWTDNQLGYKHLSLMGECSHKCSVAPNRTSGASVFLHNFTAV